MRFPKPMNAQKIGWPTQTGEETTLDRDSRSYRNRIESNWGKTKLYEFSWLGIQTWVNSLHDANGGPLAASSVVKAFQILDRMLEAAKLDRRLPFNPAEGVKLPRVKKQHPEDRRPPTYAQLWLIRANLPDYMHALQIVAQETGLRWGELAGLRWCWVDLKARRLHVREVLTEVRGKIKRKAYPKSDAGLRTVPLTGLACRVLRELFAVESDASTAVSEPVDGFRENELVFHGRNKKSRQGQPYRAPIRRSAFRRLWIKAIKAAGVARMKVKKYWAEEPHPETGRMRKVERARTDYWPDFHDQRDAYASRLHDRGVPEVIVQEVLGHERAGKVSGSTPTPLPTSLVRCSQPWSRRSQGRSVRCVWSRESHICCSRSASTSTVHSCIWTLQGWKHPRADGWVRHSRPSLMGSSRKAWRFITRVWLPNIY
ncbi:tyrosine-type recombinase/integrase [Streptomyces cyaneofuscatus]|uniref:tyrosine-type recombinase/integrase n=1 Tax=Streptomyces cyaneofuscatus TaxID=66883 RepID=UPI002955B648|nr:tyrosine-type recombinase/integrase [Streptomyces cyaneofuscatus]WOP10321.1 tyrosine-type recombinase/integrase [Streptomyces cyaneofuscatus]